MARRHPIVGGYSLWNGGAEIYTYETADRCYYLVLRYRGQFWAIQPIIEITLEDLQMPELARWYMGSLVDGVVRSWDAYQRSDLWC